MRVSAGMTGVGCVQSGLGALDSRLRGNDVDGGGNDGRGCGSDVGGCGNDEGACGKDGGVWPIRCDLGAIHADKPNGTIHADKSNGTSAAGQSDLSFGAVRLPPWTLGSEHHLRRSRSSGSKTLSGIPSISMRTRRSNPLRAGSS